MKPAQIDITEIAAQTHKLGDKHTQRRLKAAGYSLSRKDVKSLREKAAIADRLAVPGVATIRIDGEVVQREIRVYDSPPKWWNRAAPDQRLAWLKGFFVRQIRHRYAILDPTVTVEVLTVEVRVGC